MSDRNDRLRADLAAIEDVAAVVFGDVSMGSYQLRDLLLRCGRLATQALDRDDESISREQLGRAYARVP